MRKSVQMLIAAGVMGLPMIAVAGPEHAEHADKGDCPADCAKACCVDLAALVGFHAPTLTVGSDAPKLNIAQFIKGESVDSFEEGQVYVVEFWATWCGPCVAAFPHLSELQKEHGKDVRFIGVNIWDTDTRNEETQGDRIQRVVGFVEDQGERMSYTVAIEEGEKGMSSTWMDPAGQNGIPAAFIVNGEGKVAWVGHPTGIDETLGAVIDGSFDLETAVAEAEAEQEARHDEQLMQQAYQYSMTKIKSEDKAVSTEGYQAARALAQQLLDDNAQMLNALAWPILDPDTTITNLDFEYALGLAHRAAELTKFEDPMVLDTYAMALYKTGDVKGAIKQQKKAIKLTDNDEYKAEFEARLAQFESEG